MKIIFIVPNNFFTKKYYNDLHVDLISKYFDFELWCIVKLFNKTLHDELLALGMPDKLENVCYIETWEEFDRRLKALNEKPIIITQYFFPSNLKKAFPIVKKYNGVIIDFYKDGFSNYLGRKFDISNKIVPLYKRVVLLLSLSIIIRKIYYSLRYGRSIVDYILAPPKLNFGASKKHIKIHDFKYDSFFDSSQEKPLLDSKYAVFLDVNLPFLSDIIVYNRGKSVEPKKYFALLNSFFEFIEKKYNLEVVIAPHPKAMYSDETFNNRKIIKYKTANLINYSELVFTHYTTSNINAILAGKPLIFLYYDEMLQKGPDFIGNKTIQYARILKSPLVNLEKSFDFTTKVNKRNYQIFIDKYILNPKEKGKRNEELIINFLNSLANDSE